MELKNKLLQIDLVKNNEWLDKYISLVKLNKLTTKQQFITQEHHIIPKYYYNNNNLEIDDSAENKVHLKFSDHLLAHYYLMMCASTTKYELANANAIVKTIANPHSIDIDDWITKNKTLLESINTRRCELISIHHADVSGIKNPRATKIYQYDMNGNLEFVYQLINDWSAAVGIDAGCLRSMIARSKYKLLLINNKIYSKSSTLSEDLLNEFLVYRNSIERSKRTSYKFICENCKKEYTIKLRLDQYEERKNTRHFCFDCTKSGIMFKGIKFTEEHRRKISESKSKKEN